MYSDTFNHALHMERASEQAAFEDKIVCWTLMKALLEESSL